MNTNLSKRLSVYTSLTVARYHHVAVPRLTKLRPSPVNEMEGQWRNMPVGIVLIMRKIDWNLQTAGCVKTAM